MSRQCKPGVWPLGHRTSGLQDLWAGPLCFSAVRLGPCCASQALVHIWCTLNKAMVPVTVMVMSRGSEVLPLQLGGGELWQVPSLPSTLLLVLQGQAVLLAPCYVKIASASMPLASVRCCSGRYMCWCTHFR